MQQVRQAQPEQLDHKVLLVLLVRLEPQALRDPRVRRVKSEQLAPLERQALLGLREPLVPQVLLAHRDQQVRQVPLVLRVLLETNTKQQAAHR